jgi:signal transduction histidine kinase
VKQDFVAMISHDLRSPLTALFGTLETLVESADDTEGPHDGAVLDSSEQPLKRAKVIVSDLVNLINDFLDLEKFEAGRGVLDQTKLPLRELLSETIDAMPKAFADRITRSVSIESPTKIKVDHDRMLFALTNFLSTVLQYSNSESKVNVSVFKDESSISVSFSCPDFNLPQTVRDSCLSRYEFQPSAKNSLLSSSGLALALSRAVVQAHSGSVSFSDDFETQSIVIQIPIA